MISKGTKVFARCFCPWAEGHGVVVSSLIDSATGIRIYTVLLDKDPDRTHSYYESSVTR